MTAVRDRSAGRGAILLRSRRGLAAAAAAACSLLFVPGLVTPVAAAWTDAEFVRAPVRLASGDCTETGLYTASASSALLAGTVQGVRVGGGSAIAGVAVGPRTDAVTTTATLRTADTGATPVVGGVPLPLVLSTGGSWTQTAATSGTGASSASIGGSSALGTIGVSDLLGRAPSAVSLLPGLSDVALDVGTPSASARLDACAAGWGATDALTRSSGLSSLTMRLHDSAVTGALGLMRTDAVAAARTIADTASAASAPLGQKAASALAAALARVLTAGTPGPSSGTALLTASTSAIGDSIRGSRTIGVATLDCSTAGAGAAAVDLLPTSGDGTGPDTELVTAGRMTTATSDLTAVLQQQASATSTASSTARTAAVIRVDASADVLSTLGVRVATVSMTASGTAAQWSSAVDAEKPRPVVQVAVVRADLLTLQPGLAASVASELGALPSVAAAVTDQYLAPVLRAAPDSVYAGRVSDAAPLLAAHLAALPSVLTATSGQRAAGAASSWTGSLAAGASTRTALRVRVLDGTGARGDLFLGSVAVGPDRAGP